MMIKKYSLLTLAVVALSLTACSKQFDVEQAESIVKTNCKVCHAQGINGAPIIGNEKMWGPRIGKGKDALVQNAINGFGLMPPKGGRDELNQAEIELAVEYFLLKLNK